MPNYEKMYYTMFNATTDALDAIEKQNYDFARILLEKAQRAAEDIYISEREKQIQKGKYKFTIIK